MSAKYQNTTTNGDIQYTINGADIITSMGGAFTTNSAPDDRLGLQVVGKPIWQFLGAAAMDAVYQDLFAAVRQSSKSVSITFRCDGRDTLRFMTMHIKPEAEDALCITTSTVKAIPRARVLASEILYRGIKEGLPMCSHCNKVYVDKLAVWLEIDAAVAAGLITAHLSVRFDLCSSCRSTFAATTKKLLE